MTKTKTAVKVRDLRQGGGQSIYRLSEPIKYSPIRTPTQHVVCSTFEHKWGPFKGERITVVNPCDDAGTVLGFDNLVTFGPDGPVATHADVLRLLGFELTEEGGDEV